MERIILKEFKTDREMVDFVNSKEAMDNLKKESVEKHGPHAAYLEPSERRIILLPKSGDTVPGQDSAARTALLEIASKTQVVQADAEDLLKEIYAIASKTLQLNKDFEKAQILEKAGSGQATLGVGDGMGTNFVHGDYESIKLLQGKILRWEAIERGLQRAIGVLNAIPNTRIAHEDKRTYQIIPELEKLLTKLLKLEDKMPPVANNEHIVHNIYWTGEQLIAMIDMKKLPTDNPAFRDDHGAQLWIAMIKQQKTAKLIIGFHALKPPIKVEVTPTNEALFKGVLK